MGRVWREEGDGGASRAAFPFILTSRVENESYYGLATFVYGGDVRRSPQPALLLPYLPTCASRILPGGWCKTPKRPTAWQRV